MPTSESQSTGTPTISVATMNAINIDLDTRVAALPRQGLQQASDR